jgi:hypothetical protein
MIGEDPVPVALADSSFYMPPALVPTANVHIKLSDGATLPAHRDLLALACDALRADVPGFASPAVSDAPIVLSEPFYALGSAEVAHFLRAVYLSAHSARPVEESLARLSVVRLAHALDAKGLLARAPDAVAAAPTMALEDASAFAEFALRCDQAELLAACQCRLAALVREPMLHNGYGAVEHANRLAELCTPPVLAGVMAALAHAAKVPEAILPSAAEILRSNAMAAAQAFFDVAHGRGGDLFAVSAAAIRAKAGADVKQCGVDFTLSWSDDYESAGEKFFRTTLRSRSWRRATYVLGLANQLDAAQSLFFRLENKDTTETWGKRHVPAAEFWRDGAGWVVSGHAVVYLRVVSVASGTL